MIDKLDKAKLNCNIFSVYDYKEESLTELLCKFFTKLNECIDTSNKALTLLEWLKEIGLSSEVATLLNKWLEDGTLQNIINEEIFNELNEKISKSINYINPDLLEGDDGEKLQKAIDLAVKGDVETQIVLNRTFDITGHTLYVNRDKLPSQQFYNNHVKIIGVNGGIKKYDRGYWFSSNDLNTYEGDTPTHYTGDIRLENLWLEGSNQENVILIDGDKLIRTYIYDCDIKYIGTLIKSTTYTQSFYCLRNKIRYGKGTLLDTKNNYDLNFSDNLVEWIENFFTFTGANGCRVTNNLIEGIEGFTVRGTGCQALSFDNNYFEFNKSYFDFSELKGYGLSVRNSYFYDTDTSKNFIELPCTNFGSAPAQDIYLFEGNAGNGGASLFNFKKEPSSEVKILSISNNGISRNHNNRIKHYGVTMSRTNEQGSKIYTCGELTTIHKKHYTTVTYGENSRHIIEIDLGEPLGYTDIISIQLNEAGEHYDNNYNISQARLENYIIKPNSTKIKVIVSSTGVYYGTAGLNIIISVMKSPFTQWF